jgi:TonB-dependent SusC/RagA subfamily outer membrane receptor
VTCHCRRRARRWSLWSAQPSSTSLACAQRELGRLQPIEQVLASRVSGVTITRAADGGIAVRIRGGTSLHGDDQPLYVVDGTPIRPGPGGALSGINPYDIASIRVLKDPVDTAMYGVRGANGVILIELKRPGR